MVCGKMGEAYVTSLVPLQGTTRHTNKSGGGGFVVVSGKMGEA